MTLRALVAELRQHAQSGEPAAPGEPDVAAVAARVLARLAMAEPPVPGAHPDSWWGLAPLSSEAAIVPPGGTVSVSPSKVETVHKSPLDWFVQAAGGEAATDFARSLGTLVHGIAQELPEASGAEYVAELVKRWPTLGMKDNWEGKLDFQRAELMVRKLAQYVVEMRSEGRSLLAVEHDFEVRLPDLEHGESGTDDGARHAVLRGQVDRLEIDAEGRLVIVDLKTGKRQPGKADVARHPQLGAYQVAVLEGAFEDAGVVGPNVDAGSSTDAASARAPGGAALAQLGTKTKTPVIQQQDALEAEDNWAGPLVNEAARLMAGATFEARHDPGKSGFGGHGCRLPDVCPLCARGKQVTE
jgi:RecB family exonuclease